MMDLCIRRPTKIAGYPVTGGYRRVLLAIEIHRRYALIQVGDRKMWPWRYR
jgi:hypothetical protein